MSVHPNEIAYQGVESLEKFNELSFTAYCNSKLNSCDKHIEFVRNHCMNNKSTIRVLEIGSGSGKMLFRLENEGLISRGLGLELSSSRVTFSHKFSQYCKSSKVENRCGDFLAAEVKDEKFDLIAGVDVVFNLIAATSKQHADSCVRKMSNILAPGGMIVLEIMTCQREIDAAKNSLDERFRTWKPFDPSDPFQFGLDEMTVDDSGNLVWAKQFIDREGNVSGFTNVLKPYRESDIRSLFEKHGFVVEFYQNWFQGDDTADQEFIALIRKGAEH